MKKTPVQVVKERFETKEKLVEAVQKLATPELWLDRVNPEKGLGKVANQKLLRLLDLLGYVQQKFGSREKLIAAIQELEKRSKDAGYKQRLESYPTPRLVDLHSAAEGRGKRVAGAAKAAAKKASAKKTPAPKPAAKKKLARSKKAQSKAKAAKKKAA